MDLMKFISTERQHYSHHEVALCAQNILTIFFLLNHGMQAIKWISTRIINIMKISLLKDLFIPAKQTIFTHIFKLTNNLFKIHHIQYKFMDLLNLLM